MWKYIDWSGGSLMVSDNGMVKSNMRDGRILKPTLDKKGYQRIRVTIQRKKYSIKVHREVARAFLPNPKNLPQVNHKDGDKGNNSASNLEWVSNRQNAEHAITSGLWGNVFAASKRTNEARMTPVVAIHSVSGERLTFPSVSAAERVLGTKHVSAVLNGKRTKAKGYYFARCNESGGDAGAAP